MGTPPALGRGASPASSHVGIDGRGRSTHIAPVLIEFLTPQFSFLIAPLSIPHPTKPATNDAPRMPTLAESSSPGSANARPAMNSDIVKPMPPSQLTP